MDSIMKPMLPTEHTVSLHNQTSLFRRFHYIATYFIKYVFNLVPDA